jgi:D-glycero-D-manno-heptose 1,7-bisphosphate phosphatase
MSRGAVFLDRDGTLIEDVGYLTRPGDIVWYDWTLPALEMLHRQFDLFVVSNQSGVALGRLSEAEVAAVNAAVHDRLLRAGVRIRRWYVCPHTRDDGCDCIKPKPRFLYEAAEEFGISLPGSYTIGDHPHDVTFADSVGAKGLYVLTGHGEKHRAALPPGTLVVSDLLAAARWITERG